jgi:F-type H+-transporting ATPase subunit a
MGKIMGFTNITRELTPIQPEIVFYIGNLGIANSTLLVLFIAFIFLCLGLFVVPRFGLVPTRFQSLLEMTYEGVLELVQQITGSEKHAQRIMPVIASILVYFALANVIAIIPGLTDITYNGTAIFRTPTSDFNTAFGVSLAAVVVVNIVSVQQWGILGYLGKFFNFKSVVQGFKKSLMDGFIGLVEFFVGILDIIGEIAKVVSLSFRLFGNVYAAQVLAIIIMGAFAWVLPTVWSIMGNFTGLLQGFVFAALVAVYYTLGLKPEEESLDTTQH